VDHSVDQQITSDSGRGGSRPVSTPSAAVDDGGFAPASMAFPMDSSSPDDGRARTYWIWAICGFLLLSVGLVFGQTVRHEFVGFDDQGFVYDNPNVTPGLTRSGIWWALTDGPFGEWCPLSTLSHMLDCQLYGLWPAGHHLTNVLLHAASSVLLFLVLLRMTGAVWPSAWVAAVFAIHPLHDESVAGIAERRDVLSGLFFMLTLGAYALYAERPSFVRYLAVAGCFALGLMAKPMLVTVPFLLLLFDYWPLNRFRHATGARPKPASGSRFDRLPVGWRLVLEKIPLIVLAAVSCWIVLSTHSAFRSTNPVERLATRLANALVSYATYLGQSFYPVNLAVFYPHPGTHLAATSVAGSLFLLLAITAVAAYGWRRWPYLPVGWLWFLGMLVPVIGWVQIGAHARADRYTYLSQIGISIALAWGVWNASSFWQTRQTKAWRRWLLAVGSSAALVALAAVAWRQTSYWRDTERLWTHTLACTQQNALAHVNFAHCCTAQGKTEEAIAHLREALAVDSIDRQLIAGCHDLLAESLTTQGKVDEALTHYEEAVRVLPEGRIFHAQLAMALARQDKLDRAIAEWNETIRLNPALPQAHLGLANALLAQGDASAAAAECRVVLELEPGSADAMVTLGWALAEQGNVDEAIPVLEQALKADPRNASAQFRLGLAMEDRGDSRSGLTHLHQAIQLQPDNVLMLWQTAWILATSPDPSVRDGAHAAELAARAIQLSGGREPRAFDALAAGLAESKKFSAAVEAAERAAAAALARGDDALVDAIAERTRLYRQSLPYRQPASPQPAEHASPKAVE
jgi:tetratricopeptide (TPR) repeat protein